VDDALDHHVTAADHFVHLPQTQGVTLLWMTTLRFKRVASPEPFSGTGKMRFLWFQTAMALLAYSWERALDSLPR
jgi:hypothetical protein